MSAQETVEGQESSRAALARTTTSKPSPGKERLISASRSAVLKGVEEIKVEASQPVTKQSWKKRRRAAPAVVGCEICFEVVVSCMILSKLGQDLE